MWTMDELVQCGIIGESTNDDKPKLGIKQRPWWPFISLTNYVSPLLHCEIGIGNVIFELLRDINNEHIEIYTPGEESIRMAVPATKQKQNKGMCGMNQTRGKHGKHRSAQLLLIRSVNG